MLFFCAKGLPTTCSLAPHGIAFALAATVGMRVRGGLLDLCMMTPHIPKSLFPKQRNSDVPSWSFAKRHGTGGLEEERLLSPASFRFGKGLRGFHEHELHITS